MDLLLVRPLRGSVARGLAAFGAGASRDGLRSFDKASAHRLGNGFNARLDAAKPARIPGLPMADFLMV